MKTHRYCFPMRIVAMLLVLILCLDFSGASVFAAEKPRQSDTEKELALDWLTEMTGSREEAELFYARMDALGLLNGDLEPGASKLTIAGKDYTLEEAKAVLDSFADDEPVTVDRSVITVGDLRKMIEVDAQLRQTLENYDSLSPEQKTSLEDFMQAMEATGLSSQVAERVINRFIDLPRKWFPCIDASFVSDEQKQKSKALIQQRIEVLRKT